VHKGVKLLDCALYDEETETQVGRLIPNPTAAEWRTLKNAWQKRDAATRDASGVREQIVQTLRVRPTLLKKKGGPPPAYAERHHWFPARIALPDALPDSVASAASAAHDARFEKRLANGTVWIRYVTDVLPTFGSTDNVLLIKQNKNVKDIAGKELLTGELKFVGLTIDPEFHSPDNVTITVSECAEEEEEGDDDDALDGDDDDEDDDDEARRARRSNPPLREHAANRVTVSVQIAVRDATVTLNADPENVEVCLGNPAMNGLFNWLQSWATVFGPAPLPIVFPSVSLDVDLKGPFLHFFCLHIFWLTHIFSFLLSLVHLVVALIAPAGRTHQCFARLVSDDVSVVVDEAREAASGVALSIDRIECTPGGGLKKIVPNGLSEWTPVWREIIWKGLVRAISRTDAATGKTKHFDVIFREIVKDAATTNKIIVPWKSLRVAAMAAERRVLDARREKEAKRGSGLE
jgi:hypothetical protein